MTPSVDNSSSVVASKRRRDLLALLYTLVYPTLLTWGYFVLGKGLDPSTSRLCYTVGKTLQFAFPALYVAFALKERWFIRRFNTRGFLVGGLFGVAVGLVIFLGGRHFMTSPGVFADLVERTCVEFQQRLTSFGLESKALFTVVFLFYSFCHSGLEEYYWRWFAFRSLEKRFNWLTSALTANIAFVFHHVVILGVYFGYDSFVTWLFSLSIGVGGFVWQLIYKKTDSIYGAWLSHALIDAGIFGLGFYMLP